MLTRFIARLTGLESDEPRVSELVWFARDNQQAQLQSWMIVAKCVKIKLQRLPDGQYEFQCYHMPSWTTDKASQEIASKRRMIEYECDRWVITQIGHAQLARADIQRHFDTLRVDYALHISWAQRQDFLRRLASQILAQPGIDWQWFMDNTDPHRQSVPQLPRPPPRLVAELQQRKQQQQQRNATLAARRSAMIAGTNYQSSQQNYQLKQQLMMMNNQNNGIQELDLEGGQR
ncbi:hypothetical protein MMC11_000780 [Xylographa trunciseda]|nr:hypothetical protein [Xylographa trunciseda]